MAKMLPVPVTALPRVQDRMSFLYLEHSVVHRQDGALTARNDQGTIHVPAASLVAVFLGPGTSVSHQAMSLLGECGTTAVWVGERGVRYYAHGRSLATSTRLLVEQAIPFTRELAVLLARSPSGKVAVWPVAQTVQEDGMCAEVLAPAPGLDSAAVEEAELIGRAVAESAGVTGVLAVELFAVETFGEPTRLYVNELAMRPHNSGHWTQDGAVTSQFAQHLRAVLDLPLGATDTTAPTTVMVNLIGGQRQPAANALARAMAAQPEARIHLYGKQWRPGRKLGHVNMTVGPDQEVAEVVEQAREVIAILRGDA